MLRRENANWQCDGLALKNDSRLEVFVHGRWIEGTVRLMVHPAPLWYVAISGGIFIILNEIMRARLPALAR